MGFFISDAWAAEPAAQAPDWVPGVFFIGIFLFFYLLIIRPQAKRTKDQKKMLETLSRGNEVVTNGGILGKVAELDDNFVSLEVGENMVIKVQRHAISNLMPKGTIKASNKAAAKATK